MAKPTCNHSAVMALPVVETRKSTTVVLRYRRCEVCGERIETSERTTDSLVAAENEYKEQVQELIESLYYHGQRMRALGEAINTINSITKEVEDGRLGTDPKTITGRG